MRIAPQLNDAEIDFISTTSNSKDKEFSMQDEATLPRFVELKRSSCVMRRSQKWIHWHIQAHQLWQHGWPYWSPNRKLCHIQGYKTEEWTKQNCEMKGQHDILCNTHGTKLRWLTHHILLQGCVGPAGCQMMPLSSKIQNDGWLIGRFTVRFMQHPSWNATCFSVKQQFKFRMEAHYFTWHIVSSLLNLCCLEC